MIFSLPILRFFKGYDFTFFGISSIIFIIGVINLYSATHLSLSSMHLYKSQMTWYLISLIVGICFSFIRFQTFNRLAYVFYGFFLLLLVLVFFIGEKGMGAQRWIILGNLRMQPSELMKIGLVMALSSWLSQKHIKLPLGLKDLFMPFMITIIPMVLIIIQPDLGTGILLFLIFFTIIFYCEVKGTTFIFIIFIGVCSGVGIYQFGLKDYQRKRISTFLNPTQDAKGAGYNAIQSKIAIGSGQFLGKGLKRSSQASLHYLPENHTDFVFSIFNEEHGFLGSCLLIFLYIILFFRYLWLAKNVFHFFDSIMAVGLLSVFLWHTFINMGMVMGLLPIVGLPLPLMSYGGSSLLTFGICNGIATSLSHSKNIF